MTNIIEKLRGKLHRKNLTDGYTKVSSGSTSDAKVSEEDMIRMENSKKGFDQIQAWLDKIVEESKEG